MTDGGPPFKVELRIPIAHKSWSSHMLGSANTFVVFGLFASIFFFLLVIFFDLEIFIGSFVGSNAIRSMRYGSFYYSFAM